MEVSHGCKMNKIYQIVSSNGTSHGLYQTLEGAQKELKKLAEERKYRLGVRHFTQDDNSFSFVLGWESVEVRFWIKELELRK